MAAPVTIGVETPLQAEVSALLSEAGSVGARLYPAGEHRPIAPESLAVPGTRLLVSRIAGEAVGLCALIARGGGTIELKRLIVSAAARGAGVGSALVREAETEARRLGARIVVLEVGTRNVEARRLYRRAGFAPRDPFPPYRALPASLFLEKVL
ncbi:GNAT family N-acetyltransferase [Methylobacterium indicum]|uniref:GNAT family N-acetyltransferase n=1 Tax=Methylobacterium indicum TaxID=1775910 RepID=UPI000652F2CE|nr:GNAT family N-acetyltransferase [Methylobacterium indicum]